ncbi:MAG: PQQ-binding-like beta-propeller repeat protein, partial [Verrucomicrobiota bacterium]|nr:PQQ-binding-like beta-propeller repeat protein [Verrucomicrobiota bacterium]
MTTPLSFSLIFSLFLSVPAWADWTQFQGDARRSGNAPGEVLKASLGLKAAVPLTDGIYAAPVVSDGVAYVIDGSGVVFAIDTSTFKVKWRFVTHGGAGNCNNVAAPAVVGKYLHVGTTAGYYYVLNRETGKVVKRIDCAEPIFSAPAVGKGRVYFATLGARIYAVSPAGEVAWTWDFVKEEVGFKGNRWLGADWVKFRGDRVTWKDHFVCSRDITLVGKTVVMPAGGRTVFVEDAGKKPKLRKVAVIPNFAGSEFPATLGQSADTEGNIYVQWHRRDNAGRVEKLRL